MTPELSLTFRKGKLLVAYLALVPVGGRQVRRTELLRPGVIIDVGPDGQPLGVEFTEPTLVTAEDIDAVVQRLNGPATLVRDLQPLLAA